MTTIAPVGNRDLCPVCIVRDDKRAKGPRSCRYSGAVAGVPVAVRVAFTFLFRSWRHFAFTLNQL